jgi:hypothetical protein
VPADPRQSTYIQVSEFTVRGAQAGKPLADLSIPESYRWVPPAVPAGLPFNVAQLYMRMAEGIREGKSAGPNFDVAVKRHQLLDAIPAASAAEPLSRKMTHEDPVPVWPFEQDPMRGYAFLPLYKKAPQAALKDPEL